MGTLYENPLNLALQDLKITIHDSTLIFPSQQTKKRSMFLSNIDQVLNFNVETIHFFNANPDFPSEIVTEKLKTALSKVLVAYDFLAGRLKMNRDLGRFEIDCNGEGVGFVVASAECSLDEIGDLVYPNPAFGKFIVQKNLEGVDNQPLCTIQVTTFKCGGFVIGISTNHTTFDGISFKLFLENLASQAFDHDKPLAITPCNDRQLLAARSPPSVKFPHPELLKLKLLIGKEQESSVSLPSGVVSDTPKVDSPPICVTDTNRRGVKSQESNGPPVFDFRQEQEQESRVSPPSDVVSDTPKVDLPVCVTYTNRRRIKSRESNNPPVFDCQQEQLDFKIFKLTSNDINHLKQKAKSSGGTKPTTKITSFNTVTAHLWRCKALSSSSSDSDRLSTILYAVDIRSRLNPPLPSSYTGNAVLSAYATARCSDLQQWRFSKIVDMVSEGGTRMTDEYIRSAIDWGEIYKGFPHGDFMISSWWRLGFVDVEYPWGKPKYSCPVVSHRKDIVLLFPDIIGDDDKKKDNGVNILVALPTKEMEKFQYLFYKLLA